MAKKPPPPRRASRTRRNPRPAPVADPESSGRVERRREVRAPAPSREPVDEAVDRPATRPGPTVVGIGASAGGLTALEAFFEHVPERSGVCIVVQVHQHAAHTTILPELLSKHSRIKVSLSGRSAALEPNTALVVPPGTLATIRGRRLQITPADRDAARLPIDVLFRSMAQELGEDAVGVVLSGSGSDGALGVAEIKAAGGMVLVQSPESAEYKSMPASAIATQRADYVLAPQDMPERIARYAQRHSRVAGVDEARPEQDEDALAKILTILRARTGNDFAAYKKSTIRRRVERRLMVHGLGNAWEYAGLIERTPFEVDALFREVLISVTSFFRDPEAFSVLEQELTKVIEQKAEDGGVRIWVPACATGEEAYSLAILVKEALQKSGKNLRVQIFATDLDHQAIEAARTARYPDGIAADVSAERLQRYFVKEEGCYRVNKDIRELLVFASQNVIKDPPFTKLDLVSCRNLLIYLEPELQKRVLSLFGYALYPGGMLMLGTSENISGHEDRFTTLDRKWKLFRRRNGGAPSMLDVTVGLPQGTTPRGVLVSDRGSSRPQSGIAPIAERLLLNQLVGPSVIVSDRGEIVYLHGRTGPFLEPAAGEPTNNLFMMAREGLRLEVPAAIRLAAGQDQPVVRRGLQVKSNGGFAPVTVTVRRVTEPEVLHGTFLVTFELEPPAPQSPESPTPAEPSRKHTARISALEADLQRTRENLQGMIQALETSNEQLKSTNEEMQSTNEELQSTNEELETSREEMQSLNEELQTVNSELEVRNRDMSQANDDMQNLLNSTEVATIFLDDKLSIKRFTTQAKKVFSLIDSDVGRPLADLAANLRYDALLEDARTVLRTLVYREAEVQTGEGAWRVMRIVPYRTHDNLIDGLVLTFIDIDRVKRRQLMAEERVADLDAVLQGVRAPMLVLDDQLQIKMANRSYYEAFQTTPKLELGEAFASVGGRRWDQPELLAKIHAVLDGGDGVDGHRFETRLVSGRDGDSELVIQGSRLESSGESRVLLVFNEGRTVKQTP